LSTGYIEIQVKRGNTGSSDSVLPLNWRAGDPAPDSITLPASLNETFHLFILEKNLTEVVEVKSVNIRQTQGTPPSIKPPCIRTT